MSDFTTRMREARVAKGLSYEAAAARASRLLLPSQEFTSSTTRRTELGPESEADPVRVWALAQVYDVPLEELSPLAANWFQGAAMSYRDTPISGSHRSTWRSASHRGARDHFHEAA